MIAAVRAPTPDVVARVRLATEADLPGVLALYAQPDLDGERAIPLQGATAIFRRMRSYPHYSLVVADADGEVVGTYTLLMAENIAHGGAFSAVVESVAVAPDMQGRGIGRAMMADAIARARAQCCYKLALSSSARRKRAHEFYERLGFQQHGLSFVVDLEGDR
jgi:GNAT superfamily N-acetyltransferase